VSEDHLELIKMINSNVLDIKRDIGREVGYLRKNDGIQDEKITNIEKTCIKNHRPVNGNGTQRQQKTKRVSISPRGLSAENYDWRDILRMVAGLAVILLFAEKAFAIFKDVII